MHEIIPFLIKHGYTVLFVWVFAETIGLPLPSAPLFITVVALAGMATCIYLYLPICIGLGVCAALLSDIFWYYMGRGAPRRRAEIILVLPYISHPRFLRQEGEGHFCEVL